MQECIDWSDPSMLKMQSKIRRTLWRKLNDRWRGFKARLKKKYYTPYVGTEQRFTCPDERVINDQWRDLVAWWDGDGQVIRIISETTDKDAYDISFNVGFDRSSTFCLQRFISVLPIYANIFTCIQYRNILLSTKRIGRD